MYNLYEKKYNEEVQNFALQQMGRRRRAEYDDGVPRVQIPSPLQTQIIRRIIMAITTNAICNSFKKELLQGKHDFDTSSDTYKLAMYTSVSNFRCFNRKL